MENEPKTSSSSSNGASQLTLLKAVELGEYDPDQLAKFPDWHQLSRHGQFELIQQGLANRDIQLRKTWAQINNQLNFSRKPHVQTALINIEEQIKELRNEEDRLFVEYTK